MNKNHEIYFFLALVIISCCKEPDKTKDTYYNLTEEDLSWIPYEIGDSLYFLNNSSDTFLLSK